MKYEYYTQMPPTAGPLATGIDSLTISPNSTAGNITRLKSVYLDLPSGVTLSINLSTLSGQNDITSNGNEAGSIVFRSGVMISSPITVIVTGTTGTAYGVKIITEVETPEQDLSVQGVNVLSIPRVDIANFPSTQNVNVLSSPQIEVANFPSTQNVKVTNFPTTGVTQAGFSGAQMVIAAGLVAGLVYLLARKPSS